jgi:Cu(I)/Ag(I) efflux system membrane protein CusA/SilA
MIRKIIEISIHNRLLVLLVALGVMVAAGWAAFHSKLDAVPDLSDVQVLVLTNDAGQTPGVVDQQVTYPLETQLIHVPDVKAVRGQSMFEYSLVTVVFKNGTNLYWARNVVLEYLDAAKALLPKGVTPQLGPDATGAGWAYQYVLYPGWYCKNHPGGIWHDPKSHRWYAHRHQVPAARRAQLVLVRAFDRPGKSPLSGRPLVSSNINLGQLRSLQDWFVRYQLDAVPGVAEVAGIGGFSEEYQVVVNPNRLRAYHLTVEQVADAIQKSNNDVGGATVDIGELQYLLRSRGYLRNQSQLENVPVAQAPDGTPLPLRDVATVQIAGRQRQGILDWNGRGQVVGGIVVVRSGADTYRVVQRVKRKLASLSTSLPPGVFVKTGYDRDNLINRSIHTLSDTLLEEMIVVAAVCLLFLWHGRSGLVAIVVIPASMIISLAILYWLDVSANIMSLSGIAIAIGVVVDSSIVMIENAHQRINRDERGAAAGRPPRPRSTLMLEAAQEVGPALFFSLLIITISFLPIFILPGESGKMFGPLALTKTFAIGAAAVLSITVVPILMIYFVTPRLFPEQWPSWLQWSAASAIIFGPAAGLYLAIGSHGQMARYHWWICGGWMVLALLLVLPQKIIHEEHNLVSRWLQKVFRPVFNTAMAWRWLLLVAAAALCISIYWPWTRLGTQFTPPLYEGDLEYMPTTYPGISIGEAGYVLEQSDKIIKSFPEVKSVWGQIGRADTATDSAPLNMIDTIIRLKRRTAWPVVPVARFYDHWPHWLSWPLRRTFWPAHAHLSLSQLMAGWTSAGGKHHDGLNQALNIPGFAAYWTMPITNRVNMANTGSKTLLGMRIFGENLKVLGRVSNQIAHVLQGVPGTDGAIADQTLGGYYLDIHINRLRAMRYGLTQAAVQRIITMAVGGDPVSTMVRGLQRLPINLRYFRKLRGSASALRELPIATPDGGVITLGLIAKIHYAAGPPEIDSQNAMTVNYVNITTATRDTVGYVQRANAAIRRGVRLPTGYTYQWIGLYQQIQEANARLELVVPMVLLIIFILLLVSTGSLGRVLGVLLSVPFGLVGAIWTLYFLHYQLSVAVWVGIIALGGLTVEMGMVLLLYLDVSLKQAHKDGRLGNQRDLFDAVYTGAVRRIRPQTMTACAALVGLTPLLWATGAGGSVMRRLAAPMIGGLGTAFILELLVLPALYYIVMAWRLRKQWNTLPPVPGESHLETGANI